METQRMKLWGHLNGVELINLVTKITDWNPIGKRTKGRAKNRWGDDVINDLKKIKQKLEAIRFGQKSLE